MSELIGRVYDCALDPSRWEDTLAEIADVMAGESAILSLNDLAEDRLLIDKSVGWEPLSLRERQKHIPEIHARLNEWFARKPSLDAPFVASRELAADYLESAPYVQRCLKPLGIVDVMHQFLMYTPAYFSELVLFRHQRHGPITDREIELGSLLLPHLRRAVTISKVLDVRTIEGARLAEALDALRCAVFLVGGEGNLLHANRSAEGMLRSGALLGESRGALHPVARSAKHELQQAIQLATRDEARLGQTGLAIRLTDPAETPVFAHVLPLNSGELRTRLKPEAVAAVFVGGSGGRSTADLVAAAYALTPAEADVLASLLAGRTREETAKHLGTSLATTKTHLINIFSKTGVKRQSELLRLAAQIAPPIHENP